MNLNVVNTGYLYYSIKRYLISDPVQWMSRFWGGRNGYLLSVNHFSATSHRSTTVLHQSTSRHSPVGHDGAALRRNGHCLCRHRSKGPTIGPTRRRLSHDTQPAGIVSSTSAAADSDTGANASPLQNKLWEEH